VELIQCILLTTIIMEVQGMHLASYVLMDKADVVASRLAPVCLQWTNIITDFFRNQLEKHLLGGTGLLNHEKYHHFRHQIHD